MTYTPSMKRFRRFLLATSLCVLPPGLCVDSMVMVRNAGYTPMKPPMTLYGPGSMVGVKARGDYIQVFGVCGVRGSLGPKFVPVVSPTQREEMSRAAKKRFKIGAAFMEELQAEVQFKHIRTITVAFENPRIMALNVEDVLANLQFRSEDCKDAIKLIKERGDEVTMVTSTLEGDLIYSIAWEIGYDVDFEAAVPIVANLAARLGVGQSHITAHSISSPALIWGIKDDNKLAELTGDRNPGRKLFRTSTRLIPPDVVVDLNIAPMAPVVPSEDPRNAHYNTREP